MSGVPDQFEVDRRDVVGEPEDGVHDFPIVSSGCSVTSDRIGEGVERNQLRIEQPVLFGHRRPPRRRHLAGRRSEDRLWMPSTTPTLFTHVSSYVVMVVPAWVRVHVHFRLFVTQSSDTSSSKLLIEPRVSCAGRPALTVQEA